MENYNEAYARNFRELGRVYASEARLLKKGFDLAVNNLELNNILINFTEVNEELITIYDELIRIERDFRRRPCCR